MASGLPDAIAGPGFFLADEDNLRLTVYNALAGERVTLAGRRLQLDGDRVEAFEREFTPASDRTASVTTLRLGAGWLLNAQIYASSGSPLIGQTFAVLSIVRGQSGQVTDLATLAAGYLTAKQRVAWPGRPIETSLDGAGALRFLTGTNPGAGNAINETVPTGARWQLLYFKCNLATSGVAGNRQPSLSFDDGTNYYTDWPAHTTTAASSNRDYLWTHGLPVTVAASAAGNNQGFAPTAWLPSGHRIHVGATALDAGDAFTAIRYIVREWLEGS